MLEILTNEFNKIHRNGSFKGIGPGCKLILALTYWREYRAMRQMAFDYDLAPSTVCDSIKWVEITLAKYELFTLGNIKEEIEKFEELGKKIECVIGDVEEQRIERPTLNQEENYSGKKKMHTTKNQLIIEEKTGKILNFYNAKGTVHDFQMLKNSNVLDTLNSKRIGGKFDSGYQGVQKEMLKVSIPYKKSKYHELTEEEKNYNKVLSSKRIKIEHTNRSIKIFRIMKETYRNHMNRYETKLQIICCIHNLNLG